MTTVEAPLVWMDLEMTGLDPDENVIIEMATLLTDSQLEVIAEGPVVAIHQPESELAKMDDWNVNQHGSSGLTARVRASTIDTAAAEEATLAFLRQYLEPGMSPLCGNSICQDRRFLVRHMPALNAFLHYRMIDVSTVKELARRWYPEALEGFSKQGAHLALEDIKDSISELKHYRERVFRH